MSHRLRRRYGHSFDRVVVGEYHTRSGKVGAVIRRSTDLRGDTVYSYSGDWGAGSGHSLADMRREVNSWLERKRGIKVILPFSG